MKEVNNQLNVQKMFSNIFDDTKIICQFIDTSGRWSSELGQYLAQLHPVALTICAALCKEVPSEILMGKYTVSPREEDNRIIICSLFTLINGEFSCEYLKAALNSILEWRRREDPKIKLYFPCLTKDIEEIVRSVLDPWSFEVCCGAEGGENEGNFNIW